MATVDDEKISTSFKIPEFDLKRENYVTWRAKFRAVAKMKGFLEALKKGGNSNMPASESAPRSTDADTKKLEEKAIKENDVAMAYLIQAMSTSRGMRTIHKGKSTDWPEGLAHKVMEYLHNKMMPEDTMSKVEFKNACTQIKMRKKDDPSKLFELISEVQEEYGVDMDQDDETALVLEKAPEMYQSVLVSCIEAKGTALTTDDLEGVMMKRYRLALKAKKKFGNDDDSDSDNELTLSAFTGKCFRCGKQGHKANQCKDNDDRGGGNPNHGRRAKFTGNCNMCNRKGHKAKECYEREENASKRPRGWKSCLKPEVASAAVGTSVELLLMAGNDQGMRFPDDAKILRDPNVWIGDTAATCDVTFCKAGMTGTDPPKGSGGVVAYNGQNEKPELIGTIAGDKCDANGNVEFRIKMAEVAYTPKSHFNLFSIGKRLREGWQLGGNEEAIWIKKGSTKLKFDGRVTTPKGVVYYMYLKRDTEIAGAATESKKLVSMKQAHDMLGHGNKEKTRKTAKAIGIEIKPGDMDPCDACAAGKAKQKNVPKQSEHKPATKGEGRIYTDIATVKKPKNEDVTVTKPHWQVMVDERTGHKTSVFHEKKSDQVETTCVKIQKWKEADVPIKYVRCDNAGENKSLQARADSSDWKLGLTFEYTARDTPQQNHLAELAFATLANRGRAMMHAANIPIKLRYKVFKEAFQTATLMDGLDVINIDGKEDTRYKHRFGSNPAFADHLRIWGEAGTVKTKTATTPKVADRGVQCLIVGYALNHHGDCYRMWNPKTNYVYETRDVIWLRRMYFQKLNVTPEQAIVPVVSLQVDRESETVDDSTIIEVREGDTDIIDGNATSTDDGRNSDCNGNEDNEGDSSNGGTEDAPTPTITRTGRQVKPRIRLIEEIGGLTVAEQNYYATLAEATENEFDDNAEIACVGAGLGGGFENTNELHVIKYKEAMASDDKEKWQKAIDEEHDRMVRNKVWKVVPKSDLPQGAKIMTTTWACKKKPNGTYRARLNARGYEQVDGVHFDSSSIAAPVTNDITIRIVLILMLMASWYGELLDVNGAFLMGLFENGERIHLHVPEGFERFYPANVVLLLMRTIYGLKQAAKMYWIATLDAMYDMNYKRCKVDPCLYYQWFQDELVIWLSWVDDNLCVGPKNRVLLAKKEMMDRFDCDEIGNMDEYVGCKLERDYEKRTMKFTQPVLLQSFDDEFELPDGKAPVTPAPAGDTLMKGKPNESMSANDQKKYRSGVGKLLHMVKWSRPECMNRVRELSRFMGEGTYGHMHAMLRTMKHCISKPTRGLTLKPSMTWNGDRNFEFVVRGKSDSDYAKCTDTRKSISGYCTYLCDAVVTVKSGMQRIVALSVSEAELYAATQCAQDMLYIYRLLSNIGLKVKLPMVLEVDNQGAVDLANNWSVGGRTRHVEVRQYFLREMKEQGLIVVKWCSGDSNESDLFTKNLGGPDFEKHAGVFCSD